MDEYWNKLMNDELKVNQVNTSGLNLSKAKFNQTRIVGAGIII